MSRENPLVFYPRRLCEVLATHVKLAAFYLHLDRIRRCVERDPSPHSDPARAPIDGGQLIPTASRRRENKAIAGAAA